MGRRQKPPGRAATRPPAAADAAPEPKAPWWQRLSAKIIALVVAVVTAVLVAAATAYVNRVVPPPEPVPTPGSGFQPAVGTIPACGQVYALDRVVDPRTGAAPLLAVDGSDTPAFDALLDRERAAPVGAITVEIVITGRLQRPTRILDVRADGVRAEPSAAGTELTTDCAGDSQTRLVTLDMDRPPRSLMHSGKPFFAEHDLDVTVTERETLRVSVTAQRRSYRWVFRIDHIDGAGARTTSYLDARGRLHRDRARVPEDAYFRITGAAKAYGARYIEEGGRFRLG
ncbi:hypothetical protein ACIBSW_10750 [Actinoplanes sp. NPDC049668]|uniref:hypothetical protein n=1 Tax=unclassified Actinoplanes TaxID=2626549 RepID=UPI0033AF8260